MKKILFMVGGGTVTPPNPLDPPAKMTILSVGEAFVFTSDLIMNGLLTLTVQGTGEVFWGDGTSDVYDNTIDILLTHTYTNFDGEIWFVGSLTKFRNATTECDLYHDLASLPRELTYYENRGVNRTYGLIDNLPSGLTFYHNQGLNTVSGNIGNLPIGLLIFTNQGNNTTSGDIGNLPSGLIEHNSTGANTTSGDLGNIPSGLTVYNNQGLNTVSSYTSPHIFSSSIVYLRNIPALGFGFSSLEVDNILIDLDSSGMASGTINLSGDNAVRTPASDTAVSNLQGRGVSITTS